MNELSVVVVMLRQPNLKDPNEKRSDPFWEFGSFGCTKCHRNNLMNPRRLHELEGSLLAFAQGGRSETRLVHVTPPVTTVAHGSFGEAKWNPIEMPIAYDSAPLLINNYGESDFPLLFEMILEVNQTTPVAKFASKFRSRRRALDHELGRQVVETYRRFRSDGAKISKHYVDALPFCPPLIDGVRKNTYEANLSL